MSDKSEQSSSSVLAQRTQPIRQDDTDNDADTVLETSTSENGDSKQRGKGLIYESYISFYDFKSAKKEMAGEICGSKWVFDKKHSTSNGDKHYYRCQKGCTKRLYLLLHNDSQHVTAFVSDNEHQHKQVKQGLPEETIKFVTSLLDSGITSPKAILREIRANNLPQITATQLRNFKTRYMAKKYGKASVMVCDLQEWCEDNSEIPEDPDKVFCAASVFLLKVERDKASVDRACVVVTTKRLLSFALENDMIAADATHKLNWQNYPIFVAGTTDSSKQFHPFGIMVSKQETDADFNFFFDTIKNTIMTIYKQDYKPNILLADAAGAITNGFKTTFGDPLKRIVCWAHVIRNVDKYLRPINETHRDKIRNDIVEIQGSSNDKLFYKSIELFKKKWHAIKDEQIKKFIDYFIATWCKKELNGWYEGYCLFKPSTNNALESTNKAIKDQGTLRARLGVQQFLNLIQDDIVYNWSFDRNPTNNINVIKYEKTPVLDLKDWTHAYKWNAYDKTIQKIKHDGIQYHCIAKGVEKDLTKKQCLDYFQSIENLEYTSLSECINQTTSIRYIQINETNWLNSTCSCVWWLKNYVCDHIIAISERSNKCDYPEKARQIPLTQNRKRGRPANTKPALQYQPNEINDDNIDDNIQPKKKRRTAAPNNNTNEDNQVTNTSSSISKKSKKDQKESKRQKQT